MAFAKARSVFSKPSPEPVPDVFNRTPIRSQSQTKTIKRKSSEPSRSQSFTTGLVYNVENDPLGSQLHGRQLHTPALSNASSGYISQISQNSQNGENHKSPTDSDLSLFSEAPASVVSDYDSTSTLSNPVSEDSETLSIIYATRYYALQRQSRHFSPPIPEKDQEYVLQPGCNPLSPTFIKAPTRSCKTPRLSRRSVIVEEDGTLTRTNGQNYVELEPPGLPKSKSCDFAETRTPRVPTRTSSIRSGSSTGSSSASTRSSQRSYSSSSQSRHSRYLVETENPYFTRGMCTSFREDGSAEVKVRKSPEGIDGDERRRSVSRSTSRNSSFRNSRPCLSMLRDKDTRSCDGLDTISRRSNRSDSPKMVAPPQVPERTKDSTLKRNGDDSTLTRRNAKSVGNLTESYEFCDTGASYEDIYENTRADEGTIRKKKRNFIKRSVLKIFGRISSKKSLDEDDKTKDTTDGIPPPIDIVPLKTDEEITPSVRGILKNSKSSTLKSNTGNLKNLIKNFESGDKNSGTLKSSTLKRDIEDRGRSRLRESKDFDRNDSLERAIVASNERLDKIGDVSPSDTKVGALNAILKKPRASRASTDMESKIPPVPPHRTTTSRSTYEILNDMKKQNARKAREEKAKSTDSILPDVPAHLKRTSISRDSRSVHHFIDGSGTLKRSKSQSVESLMATSDDIIPPPPEFLTNNKRNNETEYNVNKPSPIRSPKPSLPVKNFNPKDISKSTILRKQSDSSEPCRPRELPLERKNSIPKPKVELKSPRELKTALNEPFYARTQQRKIRPKCAPPVPPHATNSPIGQAELVKSLASKFQSSETSVKRSNSNSSRTNIRDSIIMDPSALDNLPYPSPVHQPPVLIQQANSQVVLLRQSRPQSHINVNYTVQDPERPKSIFDTLLDHSGTLRRMAKNPNVPGSPCSSDISQISFPRPPSFVLTRNVNYSSDQESEFDFPLPPPPINAYTDYHIDC